jgi:ArsR family transcriptional regulator
MRELAGIFRALADETRLRMMGLLLLRREVCVCEFVDVLGITQSKASRHARYLLHAGLAADRRDGLWVHYRVPRGLGREARVLVRSLRAVLGDARLEDLRAGLDRSAKRRAAPGSRACTAPKGRRSGRRRGAAR